MADRTRGGSLIVTCEHCASQFQLDESKVPAEGAKIRCSRCERPFVVHPPSQPDVDAAESMVRETLGMGPDTECDGAPDSDSESDWEFNDAPIDSAHDSAIEAVDALLGSTAGAGSTESDASPIELAAESFNDLDLDLDDEGDDIGGDVVGADMDAGHGMTGPTAFGESSGGMDDLSDDTDHDGAAFDATDRLDLGEPESWDLVEGDNDVDTAYAAVPEGPEATTRIAPVADVMSESSSLSELNFGFKAEAGDESASVRLGRVLDLGGWAVGVALVVWCLVGGLVPLAPSADSATASWSGAGFEVDRVASRWVQNAHAGPTLVVSGRLRHSGGGTNASSRPLTVMLVDERGATLDLDSAAIGPAIADTMLRDADPSEIAASQAGRARQFASVATTWTPFTAVVPQVTGLVRGFAFDVPD